MCNSAPPETNGLPCGVDTARSGNNNGAKTKFVKELHAFSHSLDEFRVAKSPHEMCHWTNTWARSKLTRRTELTERTGPQNSLRPAGC